MFWRKIIFKLAKIKCQSWKLTEFETNLTQNRAKYQLKINLGVISFVFYTILTQDSWLLKKTLGTISWESVI